jgi:hypothetical protein
MLVYSLHEVFQPESNAGWLPAFPLGRLEFLSLASGTKISLHITANWLDISPEERKFIYSLSDLLQSQPMAADGDDDEEADE